MICNSQFCVKMICFVPKCAHYTERHTCKFYRFPKDPKTRREWEKAIRRKDKQAADTSRVCSCHFEDGNKSNGPSIFPWNASKFFQFKSPKKLRTINATKKDTNTMLQPLNSNMDGDIDIFVGENFCNESQNDKATQMIDSKQMEAEITLQRSEIEKMKIDIASLKCRPFDYVVIRDNPSMVKYYTGVDKEAFDIIVKLCSSITFKYVYGWSPAKLTLSDQILMTVMKLRLNFGYTDLAFRFNTSKHTVGNIVITLVHVLHKILFECGMHKIPSQAKNILSLPHCFTQFPNCRMVIDCTEFRCEIPKKLDEQRSTFSSYKHYNSLKGLVVVAPNGNITYVSSLFPGSTSDKIIVQQSGIIDHMKPGDLILADKGFLIQDVVPDGVSVNIPPFLTSPQFTPAELEITRNIARARIHVERAIRRLKLFHVLRHIPKALFQYSSKVFQVCAALTNYDTPLISEIGHTLSLDNDDSTNDIDLDDD